MRNEPNSPDPEENTYLLGIAKALSDGLPVDWDETAEDEPESQSMKARLRFLQSVAEAHRRILNAKEGE